MSCVKTECVPDIVLMTCSNTDSRCVLRPLDAQADDDALPHRGQQRNDARNRAHDGCRRTHDTLLPCVESLLFTRSVLLVLLTRLTIAGDLDLILRVVNQAEPWRLEPAIVPIPWAPQVLLPAKLRVGFFVSDGVVTPQPPIRRAMEAALEALCKRSDVELVPYEPLRHAEANALIVSSRSQPRSGGGSTDVPFDLAAPALLSRRRQADARPCSPFGRADPASLGVGAGSGRPRKLRLARPVGGASHLDGC
jgi:hypothetical protein